MRKKAGETREDEECGGRAVSRDRSCHGQTIASGVVEPKMKLGRGDPPSPSALRRDKPEFLTSSFAGASEDRRETIAGLRKKLKTFFSRSRTRPYQAVLTRTKPYAPQIGRMVHRHGRQHGGNGGDNHEGGRMDASGAENRIFNTKQTKVGTQRRGNLLDGKFGSWRYRESTFGTSAADRSVPIRQGGLAGWRGLTKAHRSHSHPRPWDHKKLRAVSTGCAGFAALSKNVGSGVFIHRFRRCSQIGTGGGDGGF